MRRGEPASFEAFCALRCPPALACEKSSLACPDFMQHHPGLRVDLLMDDRHQELVSEGVDVALRFGTLADSTATARRLGTQSRLLVASPVYLQRAGVPQSPADLAAHSLIVGPAGVKQGNWSFRRGGQPVTIRVEGRLNISSNEGAIAAAVANLGIVLYGALGLPRGVRKRHARPCARGLGDGICRGQRTVSRWASGEAFRTRVCGIFRQPTIRNLTFHSPTG